MNPPGEIKKKLGALEVLCFLTIASLKGCFHGEAAEIKRILRKDVSLMEGLLRGSFTVV